VKLLDPHTLNFFSSDTGSLSMSCGKGTVYPSVRCIALFPISDPHRLISIQASRDGGERHEEIGILASLADLAPRNRHLVSEDIRFRYFVPEILSILKISRKHGIETWRAVTDRGEQSFGVIDKHENVVMTDNGTIFITDIDRLRYKITDHHTLPARSRGLLDKVLL
jgi:hypothetical protein